VVCSDHGVPHLQTVATTRGRADAFMRGVKEEAVRLYANDPIYSPDSSGDFDAEPGLSRVTTKVLALNFADDEFYGDSLRTVERDIRAVRGGRLIVPAVSDGSVRYLSMAHAALWADQIRDFVARLSAS
jgi:homoserine O-acetyltransferase